VIDDQPSWKPLESTTMMRWSRECCHTCYLNIGMQRGKTAWAGPPRLCLARLPPSDIQPVTVVPACLVTMLV